MAYPPSKANSNYCGSRRGSGVRGRFGRGNKQNFNTEFASHGYGQGSLRDYGWNATSPDDQRHDAIDMMVQTEGAEAAKLKLQTLFGATGTPYVDSVVQQDIMYIDAQAGPPQEAQQP
jgi:hypothetical protein